MKTIHKKLIATVIVLVGLCSVTSANAQVTTPNQSWYYGQPYSNQMTTGYTNSYWQPGYVTGYQPSLNTGFNNQFQNPYFSNGFNPYQFQNPYTQYTFTDLGSFSSYSNNGDDPEVETDTADDVRDDSAELRGEVDMNNFRNGIVFFVYGQDEDRIEDVEDDYDTYDDAQDDEDNDEFEVVRVDRDLDGQDDYSEEVDNLEEDEDYYFVICVEYDDDDNDERLECGNVEDFETDDDNGGSNDDEPDAETFNARDIDRNSAEISGDIDMNDFNNGIVFFVFGEDENDVDDVEDEDTYDDIDERGDDLQKIRVDTNLDGQQDYMRTLFGLDRNTNHYFRICVEFENDDDDQELVCGDVEDFETDN